MLRSYLILSGDLTHAFDLTFRENAMNSLENLPSLKRAGAVLFLEFLPAIVDPEKIVSNCYDSKESCEILYARPHHVGIRLKTTLFRL